MGIRTADSNGPLLALLQVFRLPLAGSAGCGLVRVWSGTLVRNCWASGSDDSFAHRWMPISLASLCVLPDLAEVNKVVAPFVCVHSQSQ